MNATTMTARIAKKDSLTPAERQLLRKIGLKINKCLYDQKKTVEWLAFGRGLARSTLREIIAGRSNPRVITLNSIAKGLGYRSVVELLKDI